MDFYWNKSHHQLQQITIVLLIIISCITSSVSAASTEKNSNITSTTTSSTVRPSNLDEQINKALNDRRYLSRQLKCAVGEVPCDSVGRKIKSLIPQMLRGNCPDCSPQDKRQMQKVLIHVQKNFPKEWNEMLKKYNSIRN